MKYQKITLIVPFDETEQPQPERWDWDELIGAPESVTLDEAGEVTDEHRPTAHPEHDECADGCGLDVSHDGACRTKPGGAPLCSHDNEQVVELLDGGAPIGRMVVITDGPLPEGDDAPVQFAAVARDNLSYRVNGTRVTNEDIKEWWA